MNVQALKQHYTPDFRGSEPVHPTAQTRKIEGIISPVLNFSQSCIILYVYVHTYIVSENKTTKGVISQDG